MDFDRAILAHRHWKDKLNDYLTNRDGTLSANTIEQDNQCELGKWIYAEGHKHSRLTEFEALRSAHARFHKAAADVVRKADSGANISGETVLGGHSEFSSASTAVVKAIMDVKHKVEKQALVTK